MQIQETYNPTAPHWPRIREGGGSRDIFCVNHKHRRFTRELIKSLSVRDLFGLYHTLQCDIQSMGQILANMPRGYADMQSPLLEVIERDRCLSRFVIRVAESRITPGGE